MAKITVAKAHFYLHYSFSGEVSEFIRLIKSVIFNCKNITSRHAEAWCRIFFLYVESLKVFDLDPQPLKFWMYCSMNYVNLNKHLIKYVERHNPHHQGIPSTSSTLPLPLVCKCISWYISFHVESDKFKCSQY